MRSPLGYTRKMLLQSALLRGREGLAHAFTTREGGVSVGSLSSLNLGMQPGENEASLHQNWARVLEGIGAPSAPLATVQQVHGKQVLSGDEGRGPLAPVGEGDALVTTVPGAMVAVRVADCVPILLAGEGLAAAVHAGWRGTVQDIARVALQAACERADLAPGRVDAAIGPCIRVCCYEVGPEVVQGLDELGVPRDCFLRDGDKPHVDLVAANRWLLESAGIGEVDVVGGCTFCDERFFSHRREGPGTGRMAGIVGWLAC